jgi:hypothetical protein
MYHRTSYPDFLSRTITETMLTGTWTSQGGNTISFHGDGTLTRWSGTPEPYHLSNNTLTTGSGETYMLIMPDDNTLILAGDIDSAQKYRR